MADTVADQLKAARRQHLWVGVVNVLLIVGILTGWTLTVAIVVACSVIINVVGIINCTRLLKSPFLFLAEVENFCKQNKTT